MQYKKNLDTIRLTISIIRSQIYLRSWNTTKSHVKFMKMIISIKLMIRTYQLRNKKNGGRNQIKNIYSSALTKQIGPIKSGNLLKKYHSLFSFISEFFSMQTMNILAMIERRSSAIVSWNHCSIIGDFYWLISIGWDTHTSQTMLFVTKDFSSHALAVIENWGV